MDGKIVTEHAHRITARNDPTFPCQPRALWEFFPAFSDETPVTLVATPDRSGMHHLARWPRKSFSGCPCILLAKTTNNSKTHTKNSGGITCDRLHPPFQMFSARDEAVVTELSPRRMDSHGVLHRQEELGTPGAAKNHFFNKKVINTKGKPPEKRLRMCFSRLLSRFLVVRFKHFM